MNLYSSSASFGSSADVSILGSDLPCRCASSWTSSTCWPVGWSSVSSLAMLSTLSVNEVETRSWMCGGRVAINSGGKFGTSESCSCWSLRSSSLWFESNSVKGLSSEVGSRVSLISGAPWVAVLSISVVAMEIIPDVKEPARMAFISGGRDSTSSWGSEGNRESCSCCSSTSSSYLDWSSSWLLSLCWAFCTRSSLENWVSLTIFGLTCSTLLDNVSVSSEDAGSSCTPEIEVRGSVPPSVVEGSICCSMLGLIASATIWAPSAWDSFSSSLWSLVGSR